MANKKIGVKKESKKDKSPKQKKTRRKSKLGQWFKSFFTGEFLFPKNFGRSPLVFIIYCCGLILTYLVLKYEPVKRYNRIVELNKIILEKNARNNKIKSEIVFMGSSDNLMYDFNFDNEIEVFKQPIIIYSEEIIR